MGPVVDELAVDDSLAAALLEEEKVAVIPGHPFGAENHVRLTFSTSEAEIRKGLDRIVRFAGRIEKA